LSQRKSAAPGPARVELIAKLLRHGQRYVSPTAEIVETADWLASRGIVDVRRGYAVRCANSMDRDFPPVSRDCDGLIVLRGQADEGGGDYRCPACERIVYPDADGKDRLETLTILLRRVGIEKFLIKHCGKDARGQQFQSGVLTLPIERVNASICLPEFCSDSLLLHRSVAISQISVYVTVEPDAQLRMVLDIGIAHVAFSRILTGEIDLCSMLRDRMRNGPPECSNVDVPAYGFGVTVIGPRVEPVPLPRGFRVRLNSEGLWVDDLLAVKAERRTAILILQALIHRFAQDIRAGNQVAAMSVDQIADAVERAGDLESDEKRDTESIRRTIDRLRDEIAEAILKTTGKPIDEHDIIENVSRSGTGKGAKGYRLNSRTVTLAAAVV
jgi:hypothetical protein